ncbi:MAG: hypothetical protein LPK45_11050, partial [Bacteroidota bacterium]|nr:hypothetical protein [Bacteroidota bacterium]MDX5431639.1 hypothetical protein [Bacteroidota bacterium]MDX5470357.1 hypothetical protein [Bacteroidota bacterium]
NHQNKRLFDLLSSLGMLALLPFLLITVKNKAGFLKNLFQVLAGSKTWVGYIPGTEPGNLPVIPPGVISPAGSVQPDHLSVDPDIINLRYARDFSVNGDLQILLSHLSELGR